MEITSLKCNNCSANLEINPKIKFFTCTFCGSSLTIKKTGNVMFTEVLDEIKEDTETLISHSEVMLVEKEIDRLDREWLLDREQYKVHGKHGSYFPEESSQGGPLVLMIGSVFAFVVLITIISQANSMGAGLPVMLFAFLFIGFIIVITTLNSNKKTEYLAAKKKYENQRSKLISELDLKKQDMANDN